MIKLSFLLFKIFKVKHRSQSEIVIVQMNELKFT